MKQLKTIGKLKLVVSEAVQEKWVSFDDKEFTACIVANKVDGTGVQTIVPNDDGLSDLYLT